MDELEFVTELIHYLAWPALVVWAIHVFRKHIAALIDRIKKAGIKYRDFEAYACDESSESSREVGSKRVLLDEMTEDDLNWDRYLDLMNSYAFFLGSHLENAPDDYTRDRPATFNAGILCFERVINKLKTERPDAKSLPGLEDKLRSLKQRQTQ